MNEKNVRFVVEFCKDVCPNWAHCIATSSGFDKGDKDDKAGLLFCLKCVEYERDGIEVNEEELEKEVEKILEEVD